jgi:hypothetical protein
VKYGMMARNIFSFSSSSFGPSDLTKVLFPSHYRVVRRMDTALLVVLCLKNLELQKTGTNSNGHQEGRDLTREP